LKSNDFNEQPELQRVNLSTKGKRFSIELSPEDADILFLQLLKEVVKKRGEEIANVRMSKNLKELVNEDNTKVTIKSPKEFAEEKADVKRPWWAPEQKKEESKLVEEIIDNKEYNGTDPETFNTTENAEDFVNNEEEPETLSYHERLAYDHFDGYTGFLYIRCTHCGHIKGFCSKTPIRYHICPECKCKTELYNLKPLLVNCECGGYFRYKTNLTDTEPFDVNCLQCTMPVPVKYNAHELRFETITDRRNRRKY
jgi:hypothetical protein